MTLYLVVNDNVDGDNMDLFVNADSPNEAIGMMLAYYQAVYDDFDTPFRVFSVPTTTARGAIEWPDPITA